jgi:hypothetical protein
MRVCLLILEQNLTDRYPYIEDNFSDEKIVLNLTNILRSTVFATLRDRLDNIQNILAEYKRIKGRIGSFDVILFSNSEGYIAANIIRWINRDFPNITKVSLQHGFFVIEPPPKYKRFASLIIRTLTRYELIGSGLYNRSIEKYIVYNSYYRSLLVSFGVSHKDVIVSSFYLKGKEFFTSKNLYCDVIENNAILLLQPLSKLGMTSKEFEIELISWAIKNLSEKYDNVFIKQHPYSSITITDLPENCLIVSSSPFDLARHATIAFSFLSATLIELDYLGVKAVAIYHKNIKANYKAYNFFRFISDYNDPYYALEYRKNNEEIEDFYESEICTLNELNTQLR